MIVPLHDLMTRYIYGLLLVFGMIYSFGQTPTTASTNMSFTNTYCSEVTLSWTAGDGAERIVIASEGSSVSNSPSDNVYYLANDTFSNGYSFSTSEYVVYNGIGNSVTVTNLKHNTTYHFAVFEYNRSNMGANLHYLTSAYPEASVTTGWISTTFTINDEYQCENVNQFTFTPSASQSGTETINYSWDFGDGQTSSAQSPSVTYSTYGLYTVELTVSTTGCEATFSAEDTVAPLPNVNFVLHVDSPNNSQVQCFNNADGSTNRFAFKNLTTVPGISGFTTLLWDQGDGRTNNNGNARIVYTEPGVYRVVLHAFSTKNAGVEFCVDSMEMIVTVKPSPIDSSQIVFSDTSMCQNGNRFFFNHYHPDASATNTWTFGDGNGDVGRYVNHSYANPGQYEVKLTVLDTAGCYDEYIDSVEVIAQPNNFFGGLDPEYCEGDAKVTLFPNLPGGNFEGDNVDNATNEFNPIQLGLNSVSYIVQVGDCKDTFTQTTNVNPLPVFSLQNDTTICVGSQYDLRVDKGNATVRWSTGSNDSFATVSSGGIVWAEKNLNGCVYRDSFNVGTIRPPSISLGNDSTLCGDGSRVIDLTTDEATYTWSDGYVGSTRTITKTGYYQATVTNKCGTASDEVDLVFLPYACDIFIPNAFSPNSDPFNPIFRPNGTVVLRKMQIYNRWGEMMYDEEGTNLGWDGNYQGEPAPQGHYFYLIWYYFPENGTEVPKLAKGELYLLR